MKKYLMKKYLKNKQLVQGLPIVGAIISAIGACICCTGPIALAIIGVSTAGLFSKLESLRPYLIGITTILLGLAFYLTYRKKEELCEGGECKTSGTQKLKKTTLWIATFLIIVLFASPYIINVFSSSHSSSSEQIADIEEYIISVEGMTCAGCKFHIERAIKKLGNNIANIEADHKNGQVYVKLRKGEVDINKIVSEINKLGYKVTRYKKG